MINLYHTTTKHGHTSLIPKSSNHFGLKFPQPVVWAIERESIPMFLFPHNCPRICFQLTSKTTSEDKHRYITESSAKRIIIIEKKWFEILQNQSLYQYELKTSDFKLVDKGLGLYISVKNTPIINQKSIANPLTELLNHNIELRITPTLWKAFDNLSKSSYQTFFINLKNASPRMIFE
ncbi:MAG: hypothetical protein KTR26_17880 [Flammeovirgaceae bacterium]|nr:hypothetical protein [Flammeovirgaceae bacterium]